MVASFCAATKYGVSMKGRGLVTICFAFFLAVFAGGFNQLFTFYTGQPKLEKRSLTAI
jgi:hypothetical protein